MLSSFDLKTDLVESDDEFIIRFRLPDLNIEPIIHVEHFGDLLRIRGQAGVGPEHTFTKSVAICCGDETPRASFHDGILSVSVKRLAAQKHSTSPKSIS